MTKHLLIRDVALRLGVAERTVHDWIKEGRLEGAYLEETPRGPVWRIPESALKGVVRKPIGRPRKEKK
jgi:predicted site-specific integrase-resolvase